MYCLRLRRFVLIFVNPLYKRNIFSVLPPEALFFEYCI
uniref:Uncharacterized protein n=1 Tax=Neisseria meningitidis alpha275 TaxID=295996 RepID=C6SMX1_NEIME|nr:hypothetical protein predicted by Glimmer/Critica [Neisseria meningitidis alpha275]